MGSTEGTLDNIQKFLALVIFNAVFFLSELWKIVSPYLTYFIDIYEKLDLGNLDVLYVIQCFIKGYLMVALYFWQRAVWLTKLFINYLPFGLKIQTRLTEAMHNLDCKYHFLLRPFDQGLFSRRRGD